MSKISIIVPIYNTSKFLKCCIDSLIEQTYREIEIILVNDGSTDNSLEIIKEYLQKDNRIIILNKKNGGLSSARNSGIKIATGEYILNVDSDDWLEKDTCEKLIRKAIQTNGDIIIGNIFLEYQNKTIKWFDLKEEGEYKFEEYFNKYVHENGKNSIWNKLIKRELYTNNKLYHPEEISMGEDGSTLLRLAFNAKKIIKINDFIYHYRQTTTSMMAHNSKKIYEYKKAVNIILEYYISKDQKTAYEKREILEYLFFYKQLFLNGYLETKDIYKIEWENLKYFILKLEENKYYQELKIKEKILLKLYKNNYKIADKLFRIFLKLKNRRR